MWRLFRRGKRASREVVEFEYNLEDNLLRLAQGLQSGDYRHEGYTSFMVNDNKRRMVAVASVRDRVVHRLLYEFLVMRYDKVFVYDAWSCRPGKGLLRAHERTAEYMWKYRDGWLWRGDVKKFFDNIRHATLFHLVTRRVNEACAQRIIREVIWSYDSGISRGVGMPIGNLTSQVFANIYLNEFDRFVEHTLRPWGYVRYGDDIVLWGGARAEIEGWATLGEKYLFTELGLQLNLSSQAIQPVQRRMHFLGLDFWSTGRRLDARMQSRVLLNANYCNLASYRSMIHHHGTDKLGKSLMWSVDIETAD